MPDVVETFDARTWVPTALGTKVGGRWWFLAEDGAFQPDPFKAKVFLRYGDGLRARFQLDKAQLPEGYDDGFVANIRLENVPSYMEPAKDE